MIYIRIYNEVSIDHYLWAGSKNPYKTVFKKYFTDILVEKDQNEGYAWNFKI